MTKAVLSKSRCIHWKETADWTLTTPAGALIPPVEGTGRASLGTILCLSESALMHEHGAAQPARFPK